MELFKVGLYRSPELDEEKDTILVSRSTFGYREAITSLYVHTVKDIDTDEVYDDSQIPYDLFIRQSDIKDENHPTAYDVESYLENFETSYFKQTLDALDKAKGKVRIYD